MNPVSDHEESEDGFNDRYDFPRLNNFNPESFDYYTAEKFNNLINKQNHNGSLKIVHFNIRGLELHFDDLLLFLNTLSTSFDIITLSECHLRINNPYLNNNRFSIDGYDNFFVFSNIKYGGCVIYSKKELKANQLTTLTNSTKYCDYTFISIFDGIKNRRTSIGVYYRHTNRLKVDIVGFIDEFENHLENELIKKHKIVVTGDFNLSLLDINSNIDVCTYYNCLLSNNLECHILKPTRIEYYKDSLQVKSVSLIDHICSNMLEYNCISGNFYYSESDHFPNFVMIENFKNNLPKTENPIIYRRYINKIDDQVLFNDMEQTNWNELVCNDNIDLDTATENLFDNIVKLCDKHAPKIKVSKRKLKYCNKPWIDKELLDIIRAKNALYRKLKSNPSPLIKL